MLKMVAPPSPAAALSGCGTASTRQSLNASSLLKMAPALFLLLSICSPSPFRAPTKQADTRRACSDLPHRHTRSPALRPARSRDARHARAFIVLARTI